MIELETERLTLRKGRTAPPTQAELEADYHRYVTGFAEPDVTFAQYQDVILGSYYKDKEGGPFGYYTIYLDIPSQSHPMSGVFSPFLAGGEGARGWGESLWADGSLGTIRIRSETTLENETEAHLGMGSTRPTLSLCKP